MKVASKNNFCSQELQEVICITKDPNFTLSHIHQTHVKHALILWLQRVIVSCKKKKIYIFFFISIIYFQIFYYIITNSRQKVLSERLTSSHVIRSISPVLNLYTKLTAIAPRWRVALFLPTWMVIQYSSR